MLPADMFDDSNLQADTNLPLTAVLSPQLYLYQLGKFYGGLLEAHRHNTNTSSKFSLFNRKQATDEEREPLLGRGSARYS